MNIYYNKEKNCTSCGAPLPVDETTIVNNNDLRKSLNNNNTSNVKKKRKTSTKIVISISILLFFYSVIFLFSAGSSDNYNEFDRYFATFQENPADKEAVVF